MRRDHGQSAATRFKEQGFERLFRENGATIAHIFRRRPDPPRRLWHFDITAGSGENLDCPGSPLVFMAVMTELGFGPWEAWFIERDPLRAEILGRRPEVADRRAHVRCGDHRFFIPRIPAI